MDEGVKLDIDTALARLQTLRGSGDQRRWRPEMPMERAVVVIEETLAALAGARVEVGRLERRTRQLLEERDAARRACAELEHRLVAFQNLAVLGSLASRVAHDFNNLVFIMMGRTELLLARLDEGDGSRRHVRQIRRAGRRASALAQQLLALGRPGACAASALDTRAALEDMREMLELAVGRSIDVELDLARDAGAVWLERGALEQIVLNLALNARDAMPSGGTLSVSTRRASRGGAVSARYVRLSVRDDGVGMDAATRARVFEPYFTTKGKGHGTGLGLANVREIVQQHRGWIEIDSAPGEGARFDIYLPVAEASVAEGEG